MTRSFDKGKIGTKTEKLVDTEKFKGILMGIEILNKSDHQVLLAFEDSTICVFNLHTKQVMDALKHPKHKEFLTWSVVCTQNGLTLIAVSVVGQLYLLTHFDDGISMETLNAQCVIRKCKGDINCTALAISPVPEINGTHRVAVGLKNGVIQIYSLYQSSKCNSNCKASSQCFSPTQKVQCQTIAECTTSHFKSIQCICWSVAMNVECLKTSSALQRQPVDNFVYNATNTSSLILFCGGSDEKITFYEFTLPADSIH